MTTPQSHYVLCCERELHVEVWNPAASETLVLWHGLTRTGRDFRTLATDLSPHYRLLIPDTLGRGHSQWAQNPIAEYTVPFYMKQAVALLDHFQVERCGWIGTSMGGIMGMLLGATSLQKHLVGLVINDIGPELPTGAIQRIASYVSKPPTFNNFQELKQYFQQVYQPFGWLSDQEWQELAISSARRKDDGRWTVHYDVRLSEPFAQTPQGGDLWEIYEQICCPVMILRGEFSDILTPSVAEQMTTRGPMGKLFTLPNCGHAPYLNTPEQIGLLKKFLQEIFHQAS